ncbi:hypothetical protein [Candidatus Palauibacter sp.]|uniref:hypothetical protein n=1 Tax=Candidatus Palauibacter sp. TaxID=3101350 RepID=UPI003B5A179C
MTGSRKNTRDGEVRSLMSIARDLEKDYLNQEEGDPWAGSPFQWIKSRPSRQVGKIGEQLVAEWCTTKGFDVTASGDSEADRIIVGKRVEIKFSTLWKSGVFKFQQLRDQNYDYAICLGISPFDAQCWAISKTLLHEHVIGKTPQHAGASGTDTFWLSFYREAPPNWLTECGGRLDQVHEIIKTW